MLKIPLELIRDHIGIENLCLLKTSEKEFPEWMQVIWYQPGIFYEDEFILFAKGEQLRGDLTGRGIISIGKPSDDILERNDVLLVPSSCDEMDVYRKVQKIILKFHKWDYELNEAISQKIPVGRKPILDQVFSIASSMLGNSIFLHDENFYLLGNSQTDGLLGLTQWNYDTIKEGYILPLETLHDFKINSDYQDTMQTTKPSIFPEATFGYRIMYQNLWDQKQYRGRICINELDREFYESDFYLLDYLSELIQSSFYHKEMASYQQMVSLSKLLVKLIERKPIDTKILDDILMRYGWVNYDTYFCACISLDDRDIKTNDIQYYCTLLTGQFSNSCAFWYENSIIIVINQSLSNTAIFDFRQHISVILREGLIKAGISSVNTKLSEFYYIYQQAVYALKYGKKKQSSFWCYCFDDYKIDYIFQKAIEEFPVLYLCDNDIVTLIEYDKTHTSGLYHTMKVYLENDRNLARTSEILGIHRSTLLYRMEKIRKMIKSNLDDTNDRFRLWVSCYLLEQSHYKY